MFNTDYRVTNWHNNSQKSSSEDWPRPG